ncbi:hypothetical protein [Paenibacillus ginsengarvi]|uniref:DNA alkylation repair protein n=1 Tax=Paenibacillus ginsengarvi TaxID=400777 RepID=A0A3B0CLI4_9BACL|nr:hypothetical protein [Paenibacillus ginsengarvi]RKN86535.1 hypothetical protein D7M11_00765 [Paenibacillus ginsengarvi]
MQDKPYFCPNCRSNRTKFRIMSTSSQSFMKEAVSGTITQMSESVTEEIPEPMIGCLVCGFIGNEMRYVKQAEREPRVDPMQ